MYCPRKKFLPACWHLPSVLMESEVWVRPAQVGALFWHNLRVCLTFWHVMYPQNNVALFLHSLRLCWLFWHAMYLQNNVALFWHSLRVCWLFSHVMYLQNNVALFWHSLRVCWLFSHAMYLQNNVALFWHSLRLCWLFWRVSGSMSERVGCRVMAIHCYRPLLGPWDHKKVLCSNRGVVCRWNPGNELDLGVPMACQVGCDVVCLQIYTYVIFSFIEVGESKFIRVQWKRLFPCAVHVSLLSVRSHVSCLITVFWMFANQTLGEYSITT
jgi:hypothetical protein